MIMQRSLFASAVLGCALLVAAPTAFAADTKIVPAYVCLPSGTNYTALSEGGISNSSSTTPLVLKCPIIRDNTTAKPTLIKVSIRDNSPSTDVTCHVRASSLDGIGLQAGASVKTSGTGFKMLTLPIPTTMPTNAAYFVDCIIPARPSGETSSSVKGIIYEELD
jgi:hypothetical protein